MTDRRMSIESSKCSPQDTPYTSYAPSLHDIEKQDQDDTQLPHTYELGGPLAISPSHLSQPATPYIPDGGVTAWVQVLCGFFMFFNSWGLINTFGVFQVYYTSTLLISSSTSAISWIGSIEAFLLCCTTIFAGPLFDCGHARSLVFLGTFLVVLGLLMTSLCTSYWQLMLAQGLCTGIGQGLLFITSIAIIPTYFSTKRSFALGLAASGSSLGGVVYTILFHRLMDTHHISFDWTTRALGFVALFTLLPSCFLLRPRKTATPLAKRRVVDFSGFRELPFTLFSMASFVGFIGLYIPFFYISTFAATKAGLDEELAFYMLPILSAGSILGRIAPSFVADFIGPLNVLSLCTLIAGLLGFCWVAITSSSTVAALVIWSLLYGAFSGAFVSLQPSTVVSITDDMSIVGGRLGMNTFCAALGLLIGTPIAGVLLEKDPSWLGLQVFCGATLFLSGGLIIATRWSRVGIEVCAMA